MNSVTLKLLYVGYTAIENEKLAMQPFFWLFTVECKLSYAYIQGCSVKHKTEREWYNWKMVPWVWQLKPEEEKKLNRWIWTPNYEMVYSFAGLSIPSTIIWKLCIFCPIRFIETIFK